MNEYKVTYFAVLPDGSYGERFDVYVIAPDKPAARTLATRAARDTFTILGSPVRPLALHKTFDLGPNVVPRPRVVAIEASAGTIARMEADGQG